MRNQIIMSILLLYPQEILNEIFLNLLGGDVKSLFNVELSPFYLARKYNVVELVNEECLSSVEQPKINALTLPLFIETNNYLPKVLQFKSATDLLAVSEGCLLRIPIIDHVGGKHLTTDQYSSICHFENIRNLKLVQYKSDQKLPSNLESLFCWKGDCAFDELSNLKELSIAFCSNLVLLPKNLEKLLLLGLEKFDFNVYFPETLVELVLNHDETSDDLELDFDLHSGQFVDLLYLTKLKVLKIRGLIEMFELPNSINSLMCSHIKEYTDFTMLDKLDKIRIQNSSGFWDLPKSTKEVVYKGCLILTLRNLQGLDSLERLVLDECVVNTPQNLDIEYPESLLLIEMVDLDILHREDQIIRFIGLPSNLDLFRLDMRTLADDADYYSVEDEDFNSYFIDADWPKSLKQMHLKNLEGFYGQPSKCLDGIDWPVALEELTLKNMPLTHIVNSNLTEMENLRVLRVGPKVKVLDPLPTSIRSFIIRHLKMLTGVIPTSLPPSIEYVSLDDVTFTLTNEWFTYLTISKFENCVLSIPGRLALPLTMREIVINGCNLTSEQWNMFECLSGMVKVDLQNNSLDLFDLSVTKNLKELQLKGNPLVDVVRQIPNWDKIEKLLAKVTIGEQDQDDAQNLERAISTISLSTNEWRFNRYIKLDDIGNSYTIESSGMVVVIVTTSNEMVIYASGKTWKVDLE